MSLNSKDCENSTVKAEPSDPDMAENDTKYDPVKEFLSLSLGTGGDDIKDERIEVMYEEKTDEDDGLLKKIGKVVGIVKKKGGKKEEIEPFSKTEQTWIYSDISNTTDETTPSGSINHSSASQRSSETELMQGSDCYNFSNQQRGYLLLVINDKFYNQASRKGAHLDLIKMNLFAEKFGFKVLNSESETNLTKSETMSWLQKAQSIDHSNCDCFMFMISTHGLEQANSRKGGSVDHALVCADDQLIFTSTITEMFNETNCPSLKGKPKIFIIQACRGTSIDHGGDVAITKGKYKLRGITSDSTAKFDRFTHNNSKFSEVAETTEADLNFGISYKGVEECIQPNESETRSRKMGRDLDVSDSRGGEDSWTKDTSHDIETPCLKCDDDMLVMYAIPPGMLAWRSTTDGSWMIHYLHEVFMAYDMKAPKSFINVLTKVSAKMSQRTTDTPSAPDLHEKKAVPVIEHKLTRDILFAHKT